MEIDGELLDPILCYSEVVARASRQMSGSQQRMKYQNVFFLKGLHDGEGYLLRGSVFRILRGKSFYKRSL